MIPTEDAVADGVLPSHHDNCFGCGSNPAGLGITWFRTGDQVHADAVFDERHQGAPHLAHGGVVAALFDEAAGAVLILLEQAAVTARLTVNYAAPVPLHTVLSVRSWLAERDGRKLHLRTELHHGETLLAEGAALFVTVGSEHFLRHGAQSGEMPTIGV